MESKDSERLVLTIEEARKLLRISRGLMYQAVNSGEVPSIRIGRRILIPRVLLEQTLKGSG